MLYSNSFTVTFIKIDHGILSINTRVFVSKDTLEHADLSKLLIFGQPRKKDESKFPRKIYRRVKFSLSIGTVKLCFFSRRAM